MVRATSSAVLARNGRLLLARRGWLDSWATALTLARDATISLRLMSHPTGSAADTCSSPVPG